MELLHPFQWNSKISISNHFHHFQGNSKMTGAISSISQYESYLYTCVFLCIKFNCRKNPYWNIPSWSLPCEFGTQFILYLTSLDAFYFWSVLSSNWSKYLKCWVFSLFRFTRTISTCYRFLGNLFFDVFHPFPRFPTVVAFFKVTTVDCLRIGWAFLSTIEAAIVTAPWCDRRNGLWFLGISIPLLPRERKVFLGASKMVHSWFFER